MVGRHPSSLLDNFGPLVCNTIDFLLFSSFTLELHPAKCVLFARVIRRCGRQISSDVTRFEPSRTDALKKMELSTTGAYLKQFLRPFQWMRSAIPNCSALIRPLADFHELIYLKSGNRTNKSVVRIILSTMG